MNLKTLKDKILHQWPYKVACIVLAIVVYMLHQSLQLEKRTFTIPVQVVSKGGVVNADSKIQNISVTVRSDAETISTIHKEDFIAKVNLSGLTKTGEYQLPVQVELSERLHENSILEVKQKPQTIKIKVEKKELSEVLVTPNFQGTPAEGFEVANTTIKPKFIQVIGPESIVGNTESIKTSPIELQDKNKSFSTHVHLKNINELLSLNEDEEIFVEVEIQPIKVDKLFENVKIGIRNLPDEFIVLPQENLVNITLNGHVNSLNTFDLTDNFVYLDFSEVLSEGEYTLPLQYAIPSYYSLVSSSLENITIKVEKKSAELINLENSENKNINSAITEHND